MFWSQGLAMALAKLSEMELVCLSIHEDGDINVVDHLIWGNPGVNPNLPSPHPDFNLMNRSQQAVAAFAELQGQVLNGGLSQYLFNCANQVGVLLEAAPLMEWPDFERAVDQAFEGLDSDLAGKLVEAREVWNEEPEFEDRWAGFRTWAEQFDDDAFNNWFYDHQEEFVQRLLQMVWRQRSELTTGVSGLA